MGRRAALIAILAASSGAARADDLGDVEAGVRGFIQPAAGDELVVLTPSVSASVDPKRWLHVDAHWLADVVTGATPRTYGRPDVVSAATRFTEVRNVLGATVEGRIGAVAVSAGYDWGIENDYRSNLVRAGLRFDLFEHDTTVQANYGYGFDRICDLAQAGVPVTLRQPLDSSQRCFTGAEGLTEESLDLHSAELSVSQVLTPRLVVAAVGSYQHLDGFQSNPYRQVRLYGGLEQAQESHPTLRDRGALTLRLRFAVPRVVGTLGVDLRGYRDTWGVSGLTVEATWEQRVAAGSNWRLGARARGYVQSGATFYRDAGNADSYENAGPAGLYFTADQELAPLADLFVGAHAAWQKERGPERWISSVRVALSLDYLKIFALTPEPPNAARARGWASGIVCGISTGFVF